MKFVGEFVLSNGLVVRLNAMDMLRISKYYEKLCVQEFLLEKYPYLDEDKAWMLSCKVRLKMDKYGMSEREAIREINLDF